MSDIPLQGAELIMNDKQRRALHTGYEFMYAEYKKERRRRKPDQARIVWFQDTLHAYQWALRKACPDQKWEFNTL